MQTSLFPYLRRGAFFFIPCLLTACAGAGGAGRGAGAEVSEGKFEPRHPPASNYGVDPATSCSRTGALAVVATDVETRAKQNQKPIPQPDGRLCAMADALMGWKSGSPDEHVLAFLSNYFGLTASVPSVLITTVDTNDQNLIGARLVDPVWKFVQEGAVQPRFGLAVQRIGSARSELSKIVLLMQDSGVEIQPFPRKLAPNTSAALSGRLAPGYDTPKMYLTDPAGRLETPSLGSGPDFQSEIRCADKPGTIRVELRGQHNGTEHILASFPVACGTDQPTAVSLAAPTSQAAAAGSGPPERVLFEMINRERTQAGLAALQYDDAVAGIAKSVAEANRDQLKGGGVKVDIVERLKSEGIQSPVVLSNPAAARSPEEAQQRFASSPVHRANYMSTEVTHVGIGTAQAADTAGKPITLYTELFVRELPPANVDELRTKLQNAIVQKRKDARAGSIKVDPTLQEVAQKFADELAASKGSLPKSRQDELLKPLQGKYGAVNAVSGARADPLEFAEEGVVVSGGNLMGIGITLGLHPALGKNAPYVVEIISSPPASAKKAPAAKRPSKK